MMMIPRVDHQSNGIEVETGDITETDRDANGNTEISLKKKNYGKVPKYLQNIKKEIDSFGLSKTQAAAIEK